MFRFILKLMFIKRKMKTITEILGGFWWISKSASLITSFVNNNVSLFN